MKKQFYYIVCILLTFLACKNEVLQKTVCYPQEQLSEKIGIAPHTTLTWQIDSLDIEDKVIIQLEQAQ